MPTKTARRRKRSTPRRDVPFGIRLETELMDFLLEKHKIRRVSVAQVVRDIILDVKEGRLVPANVNGVQVQTSLDRLG